MEDLRQPEMVARSSLYLGIIAAVITLITLILAAVPFGDSLMCLIWPLLLLGAIAVLGGIGLGVAGTLMGARNKSAATMGIVLSGLSVAVFIIGNAIVEVAF